MVPGGLEIVQHVTELVSFGREVFTVTVVGGDLQRYALDNFEPVALQTDDLPRIVGHHFES